jgi:hypothetical protein
MLNLIKGIVLIKPNFSMFMKFMYNHFKNLFKVYQFQWKSGKQTLSLNKFCASILITE